MSKAHASRWARAAERGDAWCCPYCGGRAGGAGQLGVHVRDACAHWAIPKITYIVQTEVAFRRTILLKVII